MQTHWCQERISYDGSQLRAHWLLDRFGLVGDAIAAFRGPCLVQRDEIADLEDLDGPGIAADEMVHFVWESFATTELLLAVHRQRLFAAQVREVVQQHAPTAAVRRDGDDLYVADAKLSISIATVTPVSALIHFAVNARLGGAPVSIASLAELGVDPDRFAHDVLQRVADEQATIAAARAKVRGKGEWR
ncbi:MAG: DUF366 family protein [Planctomycetes bacterium]|nr:DUF366 family protein [Planctomycetota bacterium]